MVKTQLPGNAGMSLMEVTLAITVFAVAIGFTAQALMTNYVALDLQEQRIDGIQTSRSIMAEIREQRAMHRQGMDNFNTAAYLAWIDQQNTSNWTNIAAIEDGAQHLPNRNIVVEVFNPDGTPANNNSDLMEIHVTTTWTDRMGRPMEARLISILAER